MSLKRLNIIILYMICFISLLTGCVGSMDSNASDNEEMQKNITNEADTIDHTSIIKKIWISEQDKRENDLFVFINHMNNELVDGVLYNGKLPLSSYYYYNSLNDEKYPWNLEGQLEGDIIEGVVKDDNLKLNISLTFDDSKIIANLEMNDKLELEDIYIDKSNLVFRPYTLDDVVAGLQENEMKINLLNEFSFEGTIDTWEEIKLLPLIVESNKSHPMLFMINDKNEILYHFDAPFQNGLDVTEVSIDDFDGNGLSDIIIILGDKDESIGGVVAWIFFQENDLFYVNSNVQSKLNVEFYDATNLNAEMVKNYFETKINN